MPPKTEGQKLQESILLGVLLGNPLTAPMVLPPLIMRELMGPDYVPPPQPPVRPDPGGPMDYDPEINDMMDDVHASMYPRVVPKISLSHNLLSLLGAQLGNMVQTGQFNPDYLDDLIKYQASANLNFDFGDEYSVDVGYNQPGPLGNQKYKVGVTVPIGGDTF